MFFVKLVLLKTKIFWKKKLFGKNFISEKKFEKIFWKKFFLVKKFFLGKNNFFEKILLRKIFYEGKHFRFLKFFF